jgi:3-oxoacyl-[acyl-carrier protein] reductase
MRRVVVTGGTRGLGFAIAGLLVDQGYQVVVVARKRADEQPYGERLHFVPADLAETDKLHGLCRYLRDQFGPIYGSVNNAGIGAGGILSMMPEDTVHALIRLNLTAPVLLTKYLVKSMMARGEGRIVNMSSVVANTGYPGLAVYAATKAGLTGFSRSLAREVGPLGITVNAVAPGFVETDLTHDLSPKQREQIKRRSALRRLPSAQDVAETVAFLLSDKAANITGTVMTVDAGNTA